MDYFVPDIYQKSIFSIDYKKLKKDGIKCLLLDLDNTLVPSGVKQPTPKAKKLVNNLKEMGFKVIILSNNSRKRLEPFKEELGVDCSSNSFKPLKIKYLKILKDLKYKESEIACIGDQFITDILGGNRVGIKTILVNPISRKDLKITQINRLIERYIKKILHRKGLFTVGRYYE